MSLAIAARRCLKPPRASRTVSFARRTFVGCGIVASAGRDGGARFRDALLRLGCFAGEILVRCPRCGSQASVIPDPLSQAASWKAWSRRRLSCLACGHTGVWEAPRSPAGVWPELSGPEDPYFGVPLWLA